MSEMTDKLDAMADQLHSPDERGYCKGCIRGPGIRVGHPCQIARLATARRAERERAESAERRVAELQARNHPVLTTPPICGNTALDPGTEARCRALRANEGGSPDGGCGKPLPWRSAYRCVECGRWLHKACMLNHFAENGDRSVALEQRAAVAGEPTP